MLISSQNNSLCAADSGKEEFSYLNYSCNDYSDLSQRGVHRAPVHKCALPTTWLENGHLCFYNTVPQSFYAFIVDESNVIVFSSIVDVTENCVTRIELYGLQEDAYTLFINVGGVMYHADFTCD